MTQEQVYICFRKFKCTGQIKFIVDNLSNVMIGRGVGNRTEFAEVINRLLGR